MNTGEPTMPTYDIRLYRAPLPAGLPERLHLFLGHKGEPWLHDIRRRYAGSGPDLCALAWAGEAPAAHGWIAMDRACPTLGLVGHVFTQPEHRRQGLARRLLEALFAEFAGRGGRYLILGVDNPAAVELYAALGFVVLNGPNAAGHRYMLRGSTPQALRQATAAAAATVPAVWQPLHPDIYASAVFLLNLVPGMGKLSVLDIDDGQNAELKLLDAIAATERGELTVDLEIRAGLPTALRVCQGAKVTIYRPGKEIGNRGKRTRGRHASRSRTAGRPSTPMHSMQSWMR
jgi:GNAT superfamily N-acetyltransferase